MKSVLPQVRLLSGHGSRDTAQNNREIQRGRQELEVTGPTAGRARGFDKDLLIAQPLLSTVEELSCGESPISTSSPPPRIGGKGHARTCDLLAHARL